MIHPTAIVHKTVKIGDNVRIGPHVRIEEGVTIGDGTEVMDGTIIFSNSIIGDNNQIFPYCIIGGIPQDKKYAGEPSLTLIGDNNIIREFTTIHKPVGKKEKTIIGSDNYIMAYCHIAHNCIVGSNTILVNNVTLGGYAEVGDFAYLSGFVAIHQFTRIGAYSIVGGGYRVIKDVVPFALAAGEPLTIRGVNSVGLRRNGFSKERREMIKDAFRILFKSNLNTKQAIEKIKEEIPMNKDIRMLIEFIETSKRGIVKKGGKDD